MAHVGFTCAYTPLPLIAAAGYTPLRLLPASEAPDAAGAILHDNLCPHVKRVLDRALAGDVPPLAGLVLVSSCDAMRRLADAWRSVRPEDRVAQLHLPHARGAAAARYLADELRRLATTLGAWSGTAVDEARLGDALRDYDALARRLAALAARAASRALPRARLQALFNAAVALPPDALAARLAELERALDEAPAATRGVAVIVAGNMLPDPAALALFEDCGARVVGDDLCTGERQLCRTEPRADEDPYAALAGALLARPLCARTIDPARPDALGEQIAARARARGARGVILHALKFCDPYFARLPDLQRTLADRGLPLLVLEGDTTLRSLGQQRTRIEAFVEMLAGGAG